MAPESDGGPAPTRVPRVVPAGAELRWFSEAMQLWKRGPVMFAVIASAVVLVSVLGEPFPYAGFVASHLVAPLLATGLLFASLAADRGDRPRAKHLVAVFAAPATAQVAVVLGALVVFVAEAYAGWQVAGLNLFMPLPDASGLSITAVLAIYGAGVVASLPVTFVPFAAVFDGEGIRRSFALSVQAFAMNVPALGVFAACAFAMMMVAIMTMGIGLLLVLPWIAAASYAAWKDVFGLSGPVPR